MEKIIQDKDFYTTNELAKVLGTSRVSVLKSIGTGSIKARKMGRNFVIFKKDIDIKKLMATIKH